MNRNLVAFGVALTLVCAAFSFPQDKKNTRGAKEPEVHRQVEKGKLELNEGFSKGKKIKFGKVLKCEARLYRTDFFEADIVNAQLTVENPTEQTIHVSYHVVLFDKGGDVLGCAAQQSEIEAEEETTLGSALVFVPQPMLERVAAYEIVYYEDTQRIGAR